VSTKLRSRQRQNVETAHGLLSELRQRISEAEARHPELEAAIQKLEAALDALTVQTGGML
jgi:chromosome segregation ATPase